MSIKVIACGEGKLDVGIKEYGTNNWIFGPSISYIINSVAINLEIKCIHHKELMSQVRFNRFKSDKSKSHGVKAERLARFARMNTYTVAICYVDCDRNNFNDIHKDIMNGFSKSDTEVIGIPMIPKEMIESWLLADESAYGECFGSIPTSPKLPRLPEEIWGDKRNPLSNYPKNYIERILAQYTYNDNRQDIYNTLAGNSNPDTLKQKCPISYGKFHEDMQAVRDLEE
jgi:hypothetical protein